MLKILFGIWDALDVFGGGSTGTWSILRFLFGSTTVFFFLRAFLRLLAEVQVNSRRRPSSGRRPIADAHRGGGVPARNHWKLEQGTGIGARHQQLTGLPSVCDPCRLGGRPELVHEHTQQGGSLALKRPPTSMPIAGHVGTWQQQAPLNSWLYTPLLHAAACSNGCGSASGNPGPPLFATLGHRPTRHGIDTAGRRALERNLAALRGANVEPPDDAGHARAWKLFLLTPRILLARTSEQGAAGDRALLQRVWAHEHGQWQSSLAEARATQRSLRGRADAQDVEAASAPVRNGMCQGASRRAIPI